MRLDDDSGRRPAKNATPKCEKPWIIQSGINSQTKYQTVKKKRKFIVILILYNYTIVDAQCIQETDSKLITSNYRKSQKKKISTFVANQIDILIKTSDNRYHIKSKSDLEKG